MNRLDTTPVVAQAKDESGSPVTVNIDGFAFAYAMIMASERGDAFMRAAGLQEVRYRPVIVGVRAGDPWVDYLPATVESLRPSILARGVLSEPALDAALAACRAHLAEPDTVFTSYTVVQTWGRLPRPD